MRYLMLAVTTAAAFAAAALTYYGPLTLGEIGWVASVIGWSLAAGAGLAALAVPSEPQLTTPASRRPV